MGDVLGGSALESPGWWWVALIQTNCWSASAHRQVRETPRTVTGLWHRYTLIVTPLLHSVIAALVMEVMEMVVAYALCNIIRFISQICLFYYAFWMLRLVTMMWQWQNEFQLALLLWQGQGTQVKLGINIYCYRGAHDQLSLSLIDGWVVSATTRKVPYLSLMSELSNTTLSLYVVAVKRIRIMLFLSNVV